MRIRTATQLIREASLKTRVVKTPTPWKEQEPGKIKRRDIESVRLGDNSALVLTDLEYEHVDDTRCWMCGGKTENIGTPLKKIVKPTFADQDLAKYQMSKSLCRGCAFCMSFMGMRTHSIVASEQGMAYPSRAEMRDILLEPPEPPFVVCVSVSNKKWLHFRAQVAYSRDGYPVQMEETRVCVERPILANWLSIIEAMYSVFTKMEILTGNYSQNRIREFGMQRFQEHEAQIAPHRGTRLFDLAIFVAQKPQEIKKEEPECITTSTRTTPMEQRELF